MGSRPPQVEPWTARSARRRAISARLPERRRQGRDPPGGQNHPGQTVHLHFRYGTETYTGCDTGLDNTFTITATETQPYLMNAGRPDHLNPHWQETHLSFIATKSRTDLTFTSLVNGWCGAVITDLEAYQ